MRRVIAAHDLYCCLLPHAAFPIATPGRPVHHWDRCCSKRNEADHSVTDLANVSVNLILKCCGRLPDNPRDSKSTATPLQTRFAIITNACFMYMRVVSSASLSRYLDGWNIKNHKQERNNPNYKIYLMLIFAESQNFVCAATIVHNFFSLIFRTSYWTELVQTHLKQRFRRLVAARRCS